MTAGTPEPLTTDLQRAHELQLKAQRLGRTGYIISDVSSGRVYWSQSLFELRKVPPREYFSAAEAREFIHPDDRPGLEDARAAAISGRKSFTVELRIVRGDGSVIWEEAISEPQYDASGHFCGLMTVVRDITDSKRDAVTLRDQEETYLTLFNGIGDAILFVRGREIIACNAAARDMFRCTSEQLVGKTPVDVSPDYQPDGRPSSQAALEHIEDALRGECQVFEWKHRRFDGSEFDAEVTLNKVDIPGESYFFGVVRDISERKYAEAALKTALGKFTTVFDLSPMAMVTGRFGDRIGEGTIVDFNAAAERLFGTNREQAVGKSVGSVGITRDMAVSQELRQRLERERTVRDFPITLRRQDGADLDLEVSGALFELEGEVLSIFIFRDVTQQREDERRIRELNATLDARVRQLRGIADNLPVLICYQDAEGRFQFVNKTAQQWLAKSESELLGKTVLETMSPDYIAATQDMRRHRDLGSQRVEVTMRLPDGTVRTTESTYIRDVDDAGVLHGYYNLAVDVSARKAAEAELKAAHDKFASAFAASPDAMIVATVGDGPGRGTILDINEVAEKMFSSRREDFIGRLVNTAQNASQPLADAWRKLNEDGFVRDIHMTQRRADGSPFESEVSSSRFYLGDIPHVLIVIRDVTERLEAERKIRELNESRDANFRLLRDITDNLPVLITYQDAEGRFRFANKTAQEWMVKSASELLGKTVAETMPAYYISAARPVRERLLSGAIRPGAPMHSESTLLWPDGKLRSIDVTHVYDVDESGTLRGYYSLSVDVSDRKATEEQLRQSQKMEAVGKLTGGVAHDFNNLLAVILGNLELAQGKLKGREEDTMRLLTPALRAAERGATLTRSLLAFARQQPLSPGVLNLTAMMREVADLFRRTVPANIEIEFVGGAGLWKCEVDVGQLQNALLNLVVNARDAMPDGGKLTIETGNVRFDDEYARTHEEVAAGQYVMIAVSDTGTGMSPDVAARAFEPFYTTKGIGHGTGLGLSMVYGFAKQSRGHVTIYSELGHGTTVRLYLPRWIGSAEEPEAKKQAPASAANTETILVVEDDEDMRFVAVTMLRSLGYTVLEAASGRAALSVLREADRIDLLLTDVVLSGDMNGKHVADETKARRPGIRVLYMSGYSENAIVHHGRLDHGVEFLQKPFRKDDLADKVRKVLDTPRNSHRQD